MKKKVDWQTKDIDRYYDLVRQLGVTEALKIIKDVKEFRKRYEKQ